MWEINNKSCIFSKMAAKMAAGKFESNKSQLCFQIQRQKTCLFVWSWERRVQIGRNQKQQLHNFEDSGPDWPPKYDYNVMTWLFAADSTSLWEASFSWRHPIPLMVQWFIDCKSRGTQWLRFVNASRQITKCEEWNEMKWLQKYKSWCFYAKTLGIVRLNQSD